jgi:formate--tetrahydrofolate ligase
MTAVAARIAAAASGTDTSRVKPIYESSQSLESKITTIATTVYGAGRVSFKPAAKERLKKFEALGYGKLPVCIAKTQYSITDDAKVMGAPTGWTLTISDVGLSAGAGFVVAIAGSMMLMPGLGKDPQAHKLDVDDQGRVVGMDY